VRCFEKVIPPRFASPEEGQSPLGRPPQPTAQVEVAAAARDEVAVAAMALGWLQQVEVGEAMPSEQGVVEAATTAGWGVEGARLRPKAGEDVGQRWGEAKHEKEGGQMPAGEMEAAAALAEAAAGPGGVEEAGLSRGSQAPAVGSELPGCAAVVKSP
jgi:hypothetical protein